VAGNCINYFPEAEEFNYQSMWGISREMYGQCDVQIRLWVQLNATYELHRVVVESPITPRVSLNEQQMWKTEPQPIIWYPVANPAGNFVKSLLRVHDTIMVLIVFIFSLNCSI
jgi:hypothetical protein